MPPGPDVAEGAPQALLPPSVSTTPPEQSLPDQVASSAADWRHHVSRPVSDSTIRPLRRRHSQRASSRSAYRACMTMHDQPVPKTHGFAAVCSWAVPFAVAAVSGVTVPFCTAVMPLNAHPGARPMPGPAAGRDTAGHAGAGIAVSGAGVSPASRLGRHRDRREVMPLNRRPPRLVPVRCGAMMRRSPGRRLVAGAAARARGRGQVCGLAR